MSARLISDAQAPALAGFLTANLDRLPGRPGWYHSHTTAYQIACEALGRLGIADETGWGAVPVDAPRSPRPLRWDDASVTVLRLAEQRGKLRVGSPDQPTVGTGHGIGAAWAPDDVADVLEVLGLVSNSAWSADAEMVMWRAAPWNGFVQFVEQPRFLAAAGRAIATLPPSVDAEIRTARNRLAIYQGWEVLFRNEVDWMFYRGWRMDDGWMSPEQRAAALGIFHDPVGMTVSGMLIHARGYLRRSPL